MLTYANEKYCRPHTTALTTLDIPQALSSEESACGMSSNITDKLPYYNCYMHDWVLHGRECIRANAKPLRRPQSLSSAARPATSSGGESGAPATPATRRPESLSALTACPQGDGSSSSRDCQDSALAYRETVQTGSMKFASCGQLHSATSQPSIRPTATIGMSTSMLTYADVC